MLLFIEFFYPSVKDGPYKTVNILRILQLFSNRRTEPVVGSDKPSSESRISESFISVSAKSHNLRRVIRAINSCSDIAAFLLCRLGLLCISSRQSNAE